MPSSVLHRANPHNPIAFPAMIDSFPPPSHIDLSHRLTFHGDEHSLLLPDVIPTNLCSALPFLRAEQTMRCSSSKIQSFFFPSLSKQEKDNLFSIFMSKFLSIGAGFHWCCTLFLFCFLGVMMARGRLEIKRIENPTQRQSTFYKRRDGLFKKARELAVLCDSDLLLLLFSSSGKLYHYHSPSVSNVQELLRRYEVASRTRIPADQGGGRVEEMEKMCEVLEREIRFMRVGEEEEYSFPVLEMMERNLEVAIKKVREEKDRKIEAEMEILHRMVKERGMEGYELCEKQSPMPILHGDPAFGEQALFGYQLDLKLGFD